MSRIVLTKDGRTRVFSDEAQSGHRQQVRKLLKLGWRIRVADQDAEKPPQLSVLMPARDVEKFIGEAIESMQAQTFVDWELCIVVDGFSQDRTAEIATNYQRADPRVRVRQGPPAGCALTLNAALQMSRGEYIAKLDADDLQSPDRLYRQMELLRSGVDIALCGMAWADEDGKPLGEQAAGEMDTDAFMEGRCNVCTPSIVCSRRTYDEVGEYRHECEYAADIDWCMRAIRIGLTWGYVPGPLYIQRRHPGQMTHRYAAEAHQAMQELLGKAQPSLEPENSNGPLVSIIMPAYNAFRWIGWAIKSVQAQTLKGWELLVVDDGSTDGTAREVGYATLEDERIRMAQIPHGGYAVATCVALAMAEGEYIARLDADDMQHPKRLELQIAELKRSGTDIVTCDFAHLKGDSNEPVNVQHTGPMKGEAYLAGIGGPCHASVIAHRRVYDRVGGFDPAEEWDGDGGWNLRAIKLGLKWGHVASALYYHRRHPQMRSEKDASKQNAMHAKLLKKYRAMP